MSKPNPITKHPLDAAGISEFNYHQAGFPGNGDAEFAFAEAFVEATLVEATTVVDPKGNNV